MNPEIRKEPEVTEPTLNERVAKVMPELEYCVDDDVLCRLAQSNDGLTHIPIYLDPAQSLDDARIIVDRAIEVGGFDAFWNSLAHVCEVNGSLSVVEISRRMLLQTAAQQTEAALRVLEQQKKVD